MSSPEPIPTPESRASQIAEPCCNVNLTELRQKMEKYTRDEPLKATGAAFAAGIVCSALPMGRLVGAFFRLGIVLAKPALLVLGGVKLCEEIERRNSPARK